MASSDETGFVQELGTPRGMYFVFLLVKNRLTCRICLYVILSISVASIYKPIMIIRTCTCITRREIDIQL